MLTQFVPSLPRLVTTLKRGWNQASELLSDSMESSHPEQEQTSQPIARRLVRAFSPRGVLLHGSRANGAARPESDYD
jgi:hypothetical protein